MFSLERVRCAPQPPSYGLDGLATHRTCQRLAGSQSSILHDENTRASDLVKFTYTSPLIQQTT
jgi:hypothetical protein